MTQVTGESIPIIGSNWYAITIKENSIPAEKLTESVYEDWFQHAEQKGLYTSKICYEYDEKGRLHAHAIGHTYYNIVKRRYVKKNYHQHIDQLETSSDIVNWMIYMHKHYDYSTATRAQEAIWEHQNNQ